MLYIRNLSKRKTLLPVYLPWLLSLGTSYYPVLSYLIAWLGSFFIFYITIRSPLSYHSIDTQLKHQIMRPIVLVQLIFAGFMCCTSIFFFAAHLSDGNEQLALIASCQRISLLAHIAMVTGIIIFIKPFPKIKYVFTKGIKSVLFRICIISYITTLGINLVPGLIQFKFPLLCTSLTCAAYLLVIGMSQHHRKSIVFGGTVFGFHLISSTLSGYKEIIIIQFITLVFLALPYYKKTVVLLSLPCTCILLYVLPTFTMIIRTQSWFGGKPVNIAREEACQTFFDDNNDQLIAENNWKFLTERLTEMNMFIKYIKHVPEYHPYYGSEILVDALYALVPRAIWEEKPLTEKLAMERVYESHIAERASTVSAKTRPVVDGYLIAGVPGVFISMLIYGMITQLLCNRAEQLFGGYQIGCIIIFNCLFQSLWRGNTYEFLVNNLFYGYLLMYAIFWAAKSTNHLTPANL